MDAIELLKNQHEEVKQLFAELENTEDAEERSSIFAELADAFVIHSHLEEQIFYPFVFDEDTEDELRESVEEHLQAKRIIADMLEMSPDDEQWEAKCTVLKEDIDHHVEEEESELFPMVRKHFTRERMGELGRQLADRQEELESEEEPRMAVFDETEEAVVEFE